MLFQKWKNGFCCTMTGMCFSRRLKEETSLTRLLLIQNVAGCLRYPALTHGTLTPKATWATSFHSFSMYAVNEKRLAAWETRFQQREWRWLTDARLYANEQRATAESANWGLIWIPKVEKGGKSNQREENNGWETYNSGLLYVSISLYTYLRTI